MSIDAPPNELDAPPNDAPLNELDALLSPATKPRRKRPPAPPEVAKATEPKANREPTEEALTRLPAPGNRILDWSDYPPNQAVYKILTSEPWKGLIKHDLFHRQDLLSDRPLRDVDVTRIGLWITRLYGKRVSNTIVSELVQVIAAENQFDPLRDYLLGLKWDGTSRLRTMLERGFGVHAEPKKKNLVSEMGRRWMVQAVRRALEPGCKADSTLIVYSPNQGPGKSSCFAALAGVEWFSDSGIPIGQDDVRASMQLRSGWVHELGEGTDVLRSGIEALKQFLTRQVEQYTPKYSSRVVTEPRRCVFCGTTNDPRFLKDPTGARRFWPVEANGKPDPAWIRENRDQLWAEAVHEYNQVPARSLAEPWIDPWDTPERRYWFSTHDPQDAELLALLADQHEEFEQEDSWEQPIQNYLNSSQQKPGAKVPTTIKQDAIDNGVTTFDILTRALGKEASRIERKDTMRVGDVLRSLGYTRLRGATGTRGYVYKKAPSSDQSEP